MTQSEISSRVTFLLSLQKKIEQQLNHLPVGRLRAIGSEHPRYYHVTFDTSPTGRYLSSNQLSFTKELAQKGYLQKMEKAVAKELNYLSSLSPPPSPAPEEIYAGLSATRKSLVEPLLISDWEYADAWMKEPYVAKEFGDTDSAFYTSLGERVRSKSEVLIANLLNELGIPYHYEAPLKLKNGRIIYPDFTILKIRERSECYLEHCGMMDDPDYLHNFLRRQNLYIENGFIPGRDVFFSFESSSDTLNMRTLKQMLVALFSFSREM